MKLNQSTNGNGNKKNKVGIASSWKTRPIPVILKQAKFAISSFSIIWTLCELVTPCNFPLQALNTSTLFLLVAAGNMFEVNPGVPSVQRGRVFFPSGCVLTVRGHSVVVEDYVCSQLLGWGNWKGSKGLRMICFLKGLPCWRFLKFTRSCCFMSLSCPQC